MLASPFTFYRGAALIMAADLARMPSSGIYVQACGDAHLSNFGAFATPERLLAFDDTTEDAILEELEGLEPEEREHVLRLLETANGLT